MQIHTSICDECLSNVFMGKIPMGPWKHISGKRVRRVFFFYSFFFISRICHREYWSALTDSTDKLFRVLICSNNIYLSRGDVALRIDLQAFSRGGDTCFPEKSWIF